MLDASTPPLPQRFTLATERLIQTLGEAGARAPWIPIGILFVLVHRLRRMAARFATLAVAAPLASVAAAGPVGGRTPRVRVSPGPRMLSSGYPDVLPLWLVRRRGWVLRLAPLAAESGAYLLHLLHDPEMQALAAASPPVARMLRRLCWMLGVETHGLPPPPKRTRQPKPPRTEPTRAEILASVYRPHLPTIPIAAAPRVRGSRRERVAAPNGRVLLGW
jgi:hypothetical protein